MVISLEQGADLHMAQLMPLSLASVKSRLVLSFWYWLTRVVPEKGPLNGCVCCLLIFLSICANKFARQSRVREIAAVESVVLRAGWCV